MNTVSLNDSHSNYWNELENYWQTYFQEKYNFKKLKYIF